MMGTVERLIFAHLPILIGEKKRDPKTGTLSGFHIDERVKDFDAALIVDDICDGGGSARNVNETRHDIEGR